MTTKNKVLSFVVALSMMLAVFAVPAQALMGLNRQTFAAVTESTLTFSVKNFDEEYSLLGTSGTKKSVDFTHHVSNYSGVQVRVLLPNGQVDVDWTSFDASNNNIYTFSQAGMHMVQFRAVSGSEYVYSKQYFLNVENDVDKLEIAGMVPAFAQKGTYIEIPEYANFIADDGEIAVFSPSGKEVEIKVLSSKYSFTNIADELGVYFIEYSKEVEVGPNSQTKTQRVYKTVEFLESFSAPQNLSLVLGKDKNDISADGDTFFALRGYSISNAGVRDLNNNAVESEIKVAILDKTLNKYYDYETKTFVLDEPEFQDVNVVDYFSVDSVDGFSSATEGGHTYDFVYKAKTCYGSELSQTISKKAVFATTVAKGETVTPIDKYIEISIVDNADEVEEAMVSSYELPQVKVVVEGEYDQEAYNALVSGVDIEIVDGTTIYSSKDTYTTGTVGISGYDYFFKTKAMKEKTVTVKYTINYSNGDGLEGQIICSYIINFVEAQKDNLAPTDVKFTEYESVIRTSEDTFEWTVPFVSAIDKDDKGNVSYGYYVSNIEGVCAELSENVTANEGEKLTLNTSANATYVFTYTVVDGHGNSTLARLYVRVIRDGNSAPDLDLSSFVSDDSDGYQVDFTWATGDEAVGAIVFVDGEKPFSPEHTYVNGILSSVRFDAVDGKGLSLTFYSENAWGCTYGGLVVDGIVDEVSAYGYVQSENLSTVSLENGKSLEVQSGAVGFWKENVGEYTVRAENGGLFLPCSAQVFEFVTADTYVIDTETFDCNVTTKDETAIQTETIFATQSVASKGDVVEILYPYVKNVFGYSIQPVLRNSVGNIVPLESLTIFEVGAVDVYSLTFDIVLENGAKTSVSRTLSAGNMTKPVITLAGLNKNVQLESKELIYKLQGASAIDKNAKELTVSVEVFDPYGKQLYVDTDNCIKVSVAGVYTVIYFAVDSDGVVSTEKVTFVVENFVPEEDNSLSAWAIVGIVLGSIVGLGLIGLATWFAVKKIKQTKGAKKSRRSIRRKAGQEKKTIYTIAQSKDEKVWLVKVNNRMIEKAKSKEDAIEFVKKHDKKGEGMIRVYNKSGRLIDSI